MWVSKYAKRGGFMFYNMPKNIVVAGRVERQFLMVTLALDEVKGGGELD